METGNNKKPAFIHELASVSADARIGNGTKIWQYCNIMGDVTIGENCNIGQNVYIEAGCSIGNGVKIKNNIAIYSGITIDDDAFIGPNVVFTNVINPRSFIERKHEFRPTHVCKGATLGANSTIVCGHTIGEYAMVGAGSVVTKDIGAYELVVGNPAKKMGYVCRCGERIKDTDGSVLHCSVCGETVTLS